MTTLSALRDLICDALDKAPEPLPRVPDLLEFVTSKEWCGFSHLSDVQRAIVMAMAGMEVSSSTTGLTEAQLLWHFGVKNIPAGAEPAYFIIRAGVRCAKSQLAAYDLAHKALTVYVDHLAPGEDVKGQIVSPRVRQSKQTFNHCRGVFEKGGAKIRRFLLGEPLAESFKIRRPNGPTGELLDVTIELVAASVGGGNLRSTWLIGAVHDEAAYYLSKTDDLAVTLGDQTGAVGPRLKKGGRQSVVSSPTYDSGEFHEEHTRIFGFPTERQLAVHSTNMQMNPTLSADERLAAFEKDPDEAAREWDARPLSTGSEDFFPEWLIDACMQESTVMDVEATRIVRLRAQPAHGTPHQAGTDLGYIKNSSAIACACVQWDGDIPKVAVSYLEEHRPMPGQILRPSKVVERFATIVKDHNGSTMKGDGHDVASTHENLDKLAAQKERGLDVKYIQYDPTPAENVEAFTRVKRLMSEGRLIVPKCGNLKLQMQDTKIARTPKSGTTIRLPLRGWTHGDVLRAVVTAVSQVPVETMVLEPVVKAKPAPRVAQRWSSGRGY